MTSRLFPAGILGAVLCAAVWADTTITTCDVLSDWTGGSLDTSLKKEGTASTRWEHGTSSHLRFTRLPLDLSSNRSLSFWMHSNVDNNQRFMLIVQSENDSTSGIDYFSYALKADFTGWKHLELKKGAFSGVRSPLGWDRISALYFTADGWGNTPNPENVIHVDHVELIGEMPSPAGLLRNLTDQHPRLILDSTGWSGVLSRVESTPTLQHWRDRVVSRADKMLDDPVCTYSIPDGKRLLATSRTVLDRIYTLAFAFKATSQATYATRAYEELKAAAAFVDWNPSHFLDVAEMTHAFAIAYDWLYDTWSESQRSLIRDAIVNHGIEPYLEAHTRRAWFLSSESNWNIVCNGGIGMGALAIAEEDTTLAAGVLLKTLLSLKESGAVAVFGPDGAYPEGPGYWGYASKYLCIFAASLQSALDSTHGLLEVPGVAEAGNFPVYLAGADNRYFNYADCGYGRINAPWLFWLDRTFDRPLYSWYQNKVTYGNVLDIVWYAGPGRSPGELGMARDAYFRDSEVVTFRSGWDESTMLYAGLKAGNNDVGHSHLDLGTFVIDAFGKRWITDLGSDNYNLPNYFGSDGWDGQRWRYYRLRAEGHNLPVINPSERGGQDPGAETTITRFYTSPDGAPFAVADLTDAYDEFGATSVKRGIALINERSQVLLQDEITTAQPAYIHLFFHTPARIELAADARTAVLSMDNRWLTVQLLDTCDATFLVMDAAPLPSSPNPGGQKSNGRKLSMHFSNATRLTVPVLFTPSQTEPDPQSITAPAIKPLSDQTWPINTPANRAHDVRKASRASRPVHRRSVCYSVGQPMRIVATRGGTVTMSDLAGRTAARRHVPAGPEGIVLLPKRLGAGVYVVEKEDRVDGNASILKSPSETSLSH